MIARLIYTKPEHRALMAQATANAIHRGGPKMRNPFKRTPEQVAADKLKDEARLTRRADATRIRNEKFAAADARYAANKATVAEQRKLAREQLKVEIAANTEQYRATTAAIDGDDKE